MATTALATLFDWWWPAMFGSTAPDARPPGLRRGTRDHAGAGRGRARRASSIATSSPATCSGCRSAQGIRRIGVLDFQGAAIGHPAYDLASLLQDARRDIPPELAEHAIAHYLAARPELDPGAFRAAYAACAAQRHLRIAGQWVRLARRDGRPGYLIHGPRTWRLLQQAAARAGRRAARRRAGSLDPAGSAPQSAGPRRMTPRTAMLLAAGLGTRMRPLTDRTAKPLLPLGGRALIDHALDRLAEAGVETVVVNAHWQADLVAAHLARRAPARAPSCAAKPPCWTPAAA